MGDRKKIYGNAPYWHGKLAEWKASGLPLQQFCAQQSLSRSTLHRWRKRLADSETQVAPVAAPSSSFVALEVVGQALSRSPDLELSLSGGLRLRIPVGFDPETLAQVLEVVEGEQEC